jgi:cytochrome c oxidase assembly protein subunit 11
MAATTLQQRNRKVGVSALAIAAGMLALGYASVPLYRLFCQVTGFAGTTQRATQEEAAAVRVADDTISIRFDANVERGMPWEFRPEQVTDTVSIGARDMAIFIARNTSDKPVTGSATFNVEPEYVGKYFNKIQCFCFTEQRLEAHQQVRMPVLYYIDPAILDDPDARNVEQITLSYTFHTAVGETANRLDRTGAGS